MMRLWLVFVVMTILCWGAYVPTIHMAQKAVGGKAAGLWAFLLVGVAYFLVAVLVPAGLLAARGEISVIPAAKGLWIALFAGVLGALGALGIILALLNGGAPLTVPPLVFAGAPIVATFVAMLLHKPEKMPEIWFYVGILLAAGGAALVLRFKPS